MILIDSSVLIEYIKENKTELIESIFENNLQPCINHIIYSEFIYYYLSGICLAYSSPFFKGEVRWG